MVLPLILHLHGETNTIPTQTLPLKGRASERRPPSSGQLRVDADTIRTPSPQAS
jgi:hypothetical protein